ncbi:MAG TPA: lysophospholipid acyltransferase family protein [Actinomycetota bacterium]|jgi:1-acyl-sn-glycerol-3-phosphate acyltransferase
MTSDVPSRSRPEPWFHVARLVCLPPIKLWFTWRFEGLEHIPPVGPAILACNHISYLDPLGNAYAALKAGRRPRFLAKDDLFEIPVVGTVLRGSHQIPVNRRNGQRASLSDGVAALRRGELVVIYPEGTVTTRDDWMPMEAKTGMVRLALDSGAPIVPMASWGSQDVWQKSGRGSLKFGRPVWVKAGPSIDLRGREEAREDREALRALTDEVMVEVADLVRGLRDRYPARWAPRPR